MDDTVAKVFDCTIDNGFELPSKPQFFKTRTEKISKCYMFHKDDASQPGIAADLPNQSYNKQLNLTIQTFDHLNKITGYNRGWAKMINVDFLKYMFPCWLLSASSTISTYQPKNST